MRTSLAAVIKLHLRRIKRNMIREGKVWQNGEMVGGGEIVSKNIIMVHLSHDM